MKDNLRNVAIPGTGVPLSVFCQSKATAMWFVSCLVPLACLLGAINKANKDCAGTIRSREYCDRVADYFVQHLIHPDDWFSFWRLNCRLASWHSSVQGSCQYDLENDADAAALDAYCAAATSSEGFAAWLSTWGWIC